MSKVREIISEGLKLRDKEKIGLKWPLAKVTIYGKKIDKEISGIIAQQLNVKEIKIKDVKAGESLKVEFDTKITSELEAEGYAREISRHVQSFRKKIGLKKEDKIGLVLFVDNELKNMLKNQEKFIKERTNSKKLEISESASNSKEKFKNTSDFKIKNKRGNIVIITTDK